jgi:hypothetical protein
LIEAASSLTFTPAGDLTGSGSGGDIVGSTSLTFSTTATASTAAQIDGASSLTFTPAGDAFGGGLVTAASSLTFATSGDLTGSGSSVADIEGSTSLTFAASALLSGETYIEGATSLTFEVVANNAAPITVRRGDDAGFRTSGQSRKFFYAKQIKELERAAVRLTRPDKTRTKKAAAIVAAFDPIALPSLVTPTAIADLQDAIAQFRSSDMDAAELRDLVLAQAETIRRRVRRRNEEAALVLLLAA